MTAYPRRHNVKEIKTVAVVGAGIMGAGLAQLFAQNGYAVRLHDVGEEALERAVKRARQNLEMQADFGWVDPGDIAAALDRIKTTTALEDAVGQADFVIEAVPEVLELKKQVFARLGELAPGDTVLASNTSTFDVMSEMPDGIADRVLITHFFNPPQLVPLVEVVKGERTSEDAADTAMALLRAVGKYPLLIKKYLPGFVVNRVQLAINAMAYMILNEGVLEPEDIDKAVENSISLRLAVGGPFATMDLGGLDVMAASARTMGLEPPPALADRVERGDLGVKTGKGFYDYGDSSEEEILKRRDYRLMLLLDAYRKGLEA
jgi:3-hydroxybutyryl-CoA dehydrogenase